MNIDAINKLISTGENDHIEFKTSRFELNRDVFESICAFMNREGGELLLGVKKKVVYVRIPESSLVHSTQGKIFDRNGDADLEITRYSDRVTQLYLRKQAVYTENRIFPYMQLSDLDQDLIAKVRIMVRNNRPDHPWQHLDDHQLLQSAGLYLHDHQSGKEGYTLAAALLLGKRETVLSVLPHHKTDAILRVENLDRYDDRDDIRVNLIESYERLLAFIQKHLPDKFYLEKDQRVSLRDRIFREVISNLLIHREFSNAFPAKMIIERDRVITENWNRPRHSGTIDPKNFTPFPKNPVIASFFKELGWVDELGSGVRNTFKYCGIYTPGTRPEFIEGDVFKTIIPLKANDKVGVSEGLSEGLNEGLNEGLISLLNVIRANEGIQAKDIPSLLENRPLKTIERQIADLVSRKLIERRGSRKTGGYYNV